MTVSARAGDDQRAAATSVNNARVIQMVTWRMLISFDRGSGHYSISRAGSLHAPPPRREHASMSLKDCKPPRQGDEPHGPQQPMHPLGTGYPAGYAHGAARGE